MSERLPKCDHLEVKHEYDERGAHKLDCSVCMHQWVSANQAAAMCKEIVALRADLAVKCIQVETQRANVQAYRLEAQEAQAEVERLRADNLSSFMRGRKIEREWWLARIETCENGGDIADLMEAATLQIEQLPDPQSWEESEG